MLRMITPFWPSLHSGTSSSSRSVYACISRWHIFWKCFCLVLKIPHLLQLPLFTPDLLLHCSTSQSQDLKAEPGMIVSWLLLISEERQRWAFSSVWSRGAVEGGVEHLEKMEKQKGKLVICLFGSSEMLLHRWVFGSCAHFLISNRHPCNTCNNFVCLTPPGLISFWCLMFKLVLSYYFLLNDFVLMLVTNFWTQNICRYKKTDLKKEKS